jgi:large-conductance mechanosensitive channel
MILIRFALVGLIVYLIVRAFLKYGEDLSQSTKNHEPEERRNKTSKGVSKKIGEYIDYEDVKK